MTEPDRRVRRTRRTLHEALITLVLDKGYEQITVQDILDRADIGRSTFYAHYRDKEALLFASFDDVQEQLQLEIDAMDSAGQPVDPARPVALLFEHAHRHQRVYRALCGKQSGNLVYRHLHGLLGGLLREHLRPPLSAAGSELEIDVVAEFYTSAALGLLVWWIDQGFCHGPGWLAGTYRLLAAPGLLPKLTPESV